MEKNNMPQIWEGKGIDEIKQIYGQGLSDVEFKIFLSIGKLTNLNPYLREIWAVKYGTQPASIFIGRDGYRKSAQAHPEYDYHYTDAVYDSDEFKVVSGVISHNYKLTNRGKLIGAYCVVKRKASSQPMYQFVEFSEYYSGNRDLKTNQIKVKKGKDGKNYNAKETLWDSKPATMIKKVAEAQALRMAFQELFAGTYDESEQWEEAAKAQRNDDFNPLIKLLADLTYIEDFSENKQKLIDEINKLSDKKKAMTLVNNAKNKATPRPQAETQETTIIAEVEEEITIEQINEIKTAEELNLLKEKIFNLPRTDAKTADLTERLLLKIQQIEGNELYEKANKIFNA
jgi:phage recombination protein Bet